MVDILESQLFRTTSTIISGTDYTLLVDPNWLPREIETIATKIAGLAKPETYLLFTHSDYDHIIGSERFPRARRIASRAFTTNPEKETVIKQILDFDDEYYIKRSYPITYPAIDLVAEDYPNGLLLGDDEYHFYPAPGHNRDGIITHVRNRGILIVGDYLSNIEFPYVYHSFAEYRATLDTLEGLIHGGEVTLLITGHGDATESREEMDLRLTESRRYLDDLEVSVRTGKPFPEAALYARYAFPGVMSKFHAANVALMVEKSS